MHLMRVEVDEAVGRLTARVLVPAHLDALHLGLVPQHSLDVILIHVGTDVSHPREAMGKREEKKRPQAAAHQIVVMFVFSATGICIDGTAMASKH